MDSKVKKISFLIPVYNQSEDLSICISQIVAYPEDDIEIIVSDDNSTEDLEMVVKEFEDDRICWYKNSENLGLDGNILFGLDRCNGEFVFLLRTRDYIIADAVYDIISVIDKNPGISCLSGSCLDDDGLPRSYYCEMNYKKGEEAFLAHDMLHFHPSGFAFRKKWIDINMLKRYYSLFEEPRVWFMVDQILRLYLATKGDFYILSRPIWIYTYTNRNQKASVHKINNIYDQRYTYLRYVSEMRFISNEIDEKYRVKRFTKCFEQWLYRATVGYCITMMDKDLQKHYGYNNENIISINDEGDKFVHFSEEIEKDLSIDNVINDVRREIVTDNYRSFESWKNAQDRKRVVRDLSQNVLSTFCNSVNSQENTEEWIKKNNIYRIGIYGAGYSGRIVWQKLKDLKSIEVVFVCDKSYFCEMKIGDGVYAIPPDSIKNYEVDACIITPVQFTDEIQKEIQDDVYCIPLKDFLQ